MVSRKKKNESGQDEVGGCEGGCEGTGRVWITSDLRMMAVKPTNAAADGNKKTKPKSAVHQTRGSMRKRAEEPPADAGNHRSKCANLKIHSEDVSRLISLKIRESLD